MPDDIPSIGMLVCDQITHPSMYFTEPSPYLKDTYYGRFASYPKHRFKNEDELYITAISMIAGILRLDETGFTKNRDVTKRITVSCRQASILFSVILKAKGIPCRSRAGFMDFGDTGDSYLPRRKFVTASEAWIGLRKNTLNKKLDVFSPNPLEGVCEYLFMDFHALMNNEIFYSYQPLYLRGGIHTLNESELHELDRLAELLSEPDKNMEQIENLWTTNEKFSVLTNNTQNIYYDTFG